MGLDDILNEMTSVELGHASPRRVSVSLTWLLTTSVPVALFVLFAASHVSNFRETGRLTGAVLVVQELVLVSLFVFRRRPLDASHQPLHWFVAMAGSFSILLLRPSAEGSGPVQDIANLLQISGAGLSVLCLLSLGRSFGIVAANRGPKLRGPYRLVRHPIYAAYLISWAGYLMASPSPRNALILAIALFFQLRRIATEEEVLRRDSAYCSYTHRVAYRLIPGVY